MGWFRDIFEKVKDFYGIDEALNRDAYNKWKKAGAKGKLVVLTGDHGQNDYIHNPQAPRPWGDSLVDPELGAARTPHHWTVDSKQGGTITPATKQQAATGLIDWWLWGTVGGLGVLALLVISVISKR